MSAKTTDARRRGARNVAAITLLMFAGLFMLLTWRLQVGQDPAIGNKLAQATAQPAVQRRLVVHRKVVTLVDTAPTSNGPHSGSGGGGSGAQAPAATPAPVAPAPAPAPTPAPATSAS
ncbi:MAG: hypothetical protein ACRDKI_02630 [Solirubrobacterales bacterium]